MLKKPD
jgi:hypothetical protein